MNNTDFETQLRSIAGGMQYPPTPDIAGRAAARLYAPPRSLFRKRVFIRSLVLAIVLLASLLLIPPVRAAVLDFIQIGVVRIFRTEPTPVPQKIPSTQLPANPSPAPTKSSLLLLLEQIAGETTLEKAQQAAGYPILLPTYPAGLGKPDKVFVQEADGPMIVLVWIDPQNPDKVKMSLQMIPEGSWAVEKFAPQAVKETNVNDQAAVWAVGPYPLLLQNGEMKISRFINGHVLIWDDGEITYRLETDVSIEEAVKIAESLEPIP